MVENKLFLRKKLHYCLTVAAIATTVLSWFNLNSYLIIILVVCRLFDGSPRLALRTASRNVFFWAYGALFLIELAGLLYTHDVYSAWKHMESRATLVAIPFFLCAGPFTDNNGYRKLLTAYCLLLAGVCLYCLSNALWEYHWQKDPGVFFYLQLSGAVGVNAVFLSGYVLIAMFFLLFAGPLPIYPSTIWPLRPAAGRAVRIALVIFFTCVLFLLSSRLMMILLLAAISVRLVGQKRAKPKWTTIVSMLTAAVIALGTLALTDNPFSRRYRELEPGLVSRSMRREPMTPTLINGVSLRLFMWRSAMGILREDHAWALGVSGGDSQIRLNEQYMAAGMSEGYLGYNFHNEYIEVLVHSGIAGEIIFLFFGAALIVLARRSAMAEAGCTVAMILLLCATESALEMQHGLFLCSFFPLLFLSRAPRRTSSGRRSSLDPSRQSPASHGS